jgi:hypothetical protein
MVAGIGAGEEPPVIAGMRTVEERRWGAARVLFLRARRENSIHDCASLQPMARLLYEVLLHAERPSALGQKGRWYLASAHQDIAGAEAAFRALATQFPAPGVTLAIVRSEHDPASALFVDRIVKSSGRLPMIDRRAVERLDATAMAMLARQFGSPQPVALAEGLAPSAPARPLPWGWLGFVAATVGLFAAITVS